MGAGVRGRRGRPATEGGYIPTWRERAEFLSAWYGVPATFATRGSARPATASELAAGGRVLARSRQAAEADGVTASDRAAEAAWFEAARIRHRARSFAERERLVARWKREAASGDFELGGRIEDELRSFRRASIGGDSAARPTGGRGASDGGGRDRAD